jgi:Holliday junction resolvase RusA-like endonuclease
MKFSFTIAYDTNLSKNKKFCGANQGRLVQSTSYKKAKERVIYEMKEALRVHPHPVKFFPKEKVYISATFFRPDLRSDIQNFQEAICDCISKVIGVDDRYFAFKSWDWEVDKESPGVYITVFSPEEFL